MLNLYFLCEEGRGGGRGESVGVCVCMRLLYSCREEKEKICTLDDVLHVASVWGYFEYFCRFRLYKKGET